MYAGETGSGGPEVDRVPGRVGDGKSVRRCQRLQSKACAELDVLVMSARNRLYAGNSGILNCQVSVFGPN